MTEFRLEDVLAPFRGIEDNQDAVIIIGDDAAMRVLVAWTHIDNDWYPPSTACPPPVHGKMAKAWDWVRAGWEIDERRVARIAGVTIATVHAKLEVLIGNRLIYPDGSMAKGTKLALAAHTAEKLGIKPGKGKSKSAPSRDDDGSN